MRRNVFPIIMAAFAACAFSCGQGSEDPVKPAIRAAVEDQLGDLDRLDFISLELVDSSTFAQEINRRRSTLETRRSQNLKFVEKYRSEGKPRNAAIWQEKADKDARNLDALAGIEARIAEHDSLGVTELYVYRFSAKAKLASGATSDMRDIYFGITPDGQPIGLNHKKEGLYKGTGALLPGYRAIFNEEEVL